MSPEASQKARRVAGPIAASGSVCLVASMLWQAGVFDAIASKMRGEQTPPAVIMEAVSLADEHARDLVAREISPVRAELRELTRQVDRMAGALEESNRRRNP